MAEFEMAYWWYILIGKAHEIAGLESFNIKQTTRVNRCEKCLSH